VGRGESAPLAEVALTASGRFGRVYLALLPTDEHNVSVPTEERTYAVFAPEDTMLAGEREAEGRWMMGGDGALITLRAAWWAT